MPLDISEIVTIDTSVATTTTTDTVENFGRTLLLTDEQGAFDANTKAKVYNNLSDVQGDFTGSSSQTVNAARTYFARSPFPKPLVIGDWSVPTTSTTYTLDGEEVALSGIRGMTIPDATVASNAITVTALTDTDSTNIDDNATGNVIATAIRAALRAATELSDVEVAFTASNTAGRGSFTVTGIGTGGTATITGDGAEDLFGTNPTISSATAKNTSAIFDDINESESDWYFITATSEVDDSDYPAIAAYARDNSKNAYLQNDMGSTIDTSNADSFIDNNAGSGVDVESTAGNHDRNLLIHHDDPSEYVSVGAASLFSAIDFNRPNSIPILKFKSMAEANPISVSSAEKQVLDDNRINAYYSYGNTPVFAEGYTLKPNVWADTRVWIDWFEVAVQGAIFDTLRNAATRVPQTQAGLNSIRNAIRRVCDLGVRNGGIATGILSAEKTREVIDVTGNAGFNGVLPLGYLVYITPLAQQTQADREARKLPATYIWLKGSGAVQEANITVLFEQ